MKRFLSSMSGFMLVGGSLVWMVVLAFAFRAWLNPNPAGGNSFAILICLPPLMYVMSLALHFSAERD
ncbi:MAG TPA: hypothetical protein PKC67_02990 [Kiritimatiellia bacterium]|nr:hypothetical protein [Kiritimatiellia bacterium]HMP33292.1 hypothetical protein [Kiritimatiellia bacterium]